MAGIGELHSTHGLPDPAYFDQLWASGGDFVSYTQDAVLQACAGGPDHTA